MAAIDLTLLDESDGSDEIEGIERIPAKANKAATNYRTYNDGSETIIDLAGADFVIHSGQQRVYVLWQLYVIARLCACLCG